MKLTIAVLGTTVVAKVYAVAIDCPRNRMGNAHVSELPDYGKNLHETYGGSSRGHIDDIEVGGGGRVNVARGRMRRSVLDGPLLALSNDTSLRR